MRQGIQALARADPSSLARLTEAARATTGPENETERLEAERLRRTLQTLLALTGRNLRLLRGGKTIAGGCAGRWA
ncbi:MAG: hypothetical protein WBD46_13205 [Acidobacteriaceae bacterium]